jgi:hypothetical protein
VQIVSVVLIERKGDVVRAVAAAVRDQLPSTWGFVVATDVRLRDDRADGVLTISAPDDSRTVIVVVAEMRIQPRDVDALVQRARMLAANALDPGPGVPLLAAPFLSVRVREALAAQNVSYADATGNVRLELARPSVFIRTVGEDRDPKPDTRQLRTLKSPAAARVVRALFDATPPTLLGAVAQTANVSRAQTGRVAELLDREAVLTRDARGSVVNVDRTKLIERWVEDYSFARANTVSWYLEPRSLDKLLERLRTVSFRYAVSGSLAARVIAEYADARLAMIYVDDIDRAADELELTRVAERGNVALAEPLDAVMFDGTWEQDGVRYAALGQVAADLLTSPGRGPAEGEELLRQLEAADGE